MEVLTLIGLIALYRLLDQPRQFQDTYIMEEGVKE